MIALTTLSIFLGCVLATYILVPKIVGIARHKRLLDNPNSRSSHKESTPNLGGVSFFVTLSIALYFIQKLTGDHYTVGLLPCLTILFIVGLKDDLVAISPRTKLIAQLIVCSFLIFEPSIQINELHGFLSISTVPFWLSVSLVLLIVVGVINAINLIDGIDGLASIISVIALSGFAYFFYSIHMETQVYVALAMIGCLIGFLPHNMGNNNKTFMGDTGSMIIGFVLAYLAVSSLSIPAEKWSMVPVELSNLPALIVFVLLVPVMDTLRLMTVRIIRGKSPFRPDRTHFHHFFIYVRGFSHRKTTATIALIAICSILVGYVMCEFLPYYVNVVFLVVFYALSVFASFDLSSKTKRNQKKTFWHALNGSLRSLL